MVAINIILVVTLIVLIELWLRIQIKECWIIQLEENNKISYLYNNNSWTTDKYQAQKVSQVFYRAFKKNMKKSALFCNAKITLIKGIN